MIENLLPNNSSNIQAGLASLKTLLDGFQPDFLLGYDILTVRKRLSMLNHEKETLHLRVQEPSAFEASNEGILEQIHELTSEITLYDWEQNLLSFYRNGNLVDAAIYLCWINPSLKDKVKKLFQIILSAQTGIYSLNNEVRDLMVEYSINSVLEFGDCQQYISFYKLNNALESWWHHYYTIYSDIVTKGISQDSSEFTNKLIDLLDKFNSPYNP